MKKLYLFFFFITLNLSSFSQNAADVAQNFGIHPGFDGVVYDITELADGKIIVGGSFTSYKGVIENKIIRLSDDGTKDPSFITGNGFNNIVMCIVLQTDGKIIVGGSFTNYKGVIENGIIRLNTDGTKDNSFNVGTGFNNSVNSIAIQTDGKIVVGGTFTSFNGITENRIIRLNSDGTKDNSFNIGTGFNSNIKSIAIQSDGKIFIGGDFTNYNGVTENRIIRLNNDGTKDIGFNTGSGFNNFVNFIRVQPDGRILVGGWFTSYSGVTENRIIRLNSDGTKDNSFNTGTGFNNYVSIIKLLSNGQILLGGFFTSYKGVTEKSIIRLNSDGTKDSSFNTGTGFDVIVNSIGIQSNGKIFLGGNFTKFNGYLEKCFICLNADGTKNTNFNPDSGLNSFVTCIVTQLDGKIIAGGSFDSYKNIVENKIIRLNSNGTKDASFNSGIGFNYSVNSIAVQSDGKILIGGDFTSYNGVTSNKIIRLNSDGTKDLSFNYGTGFNNPVKSITVQPDGKIIVGGNFTSYNGITSNKIIRLNNDGTKDLSFNYGTGFIGGDVFSIVLQTNGKILVGGYFSSYNGITVKNIIRLNFDGTNDNSFNTGTGFNSAIYSMGLQTSGKIVIGGVFTNYNDVTENKITCLNSDGSKDNSFNTGTGFDGNVHSIAIQSNGKIIVGGLFTSFNGVIENNFIRLNSDGTKDTGFDTGTGFNIIVLAITLQTNGNILVGGNFTNYKDSALSSRLVALYSDSALSNESFVNQNDVSLWPNPTQNSLYINNLKGNVTAISIYNFEGKLVYENTNICTAIDVSNFSSGLYLAKIITEEGQFTKKFIKE